MLAIAILPIQSVLVINEEKHTLFDSRVIVEYLERLVPNPSLIPDAAELYKINALPTFVYVPKEVYAVRLPPPAVAVGVHVPSS